MAAFVSGTIFALGIRFIWPIMLGFVSKRIPFAALVALSFGVLF